jgi:hypothetical protein
MMHCQPSIKKTYSVGCNVVTFNNKEVISLRYSGFLTALNTEVLSLAYDVM